MRTARQLILTALSVLMMLGGVWLIIAGAVLAGSGNDPTFGDTLSAAGLVGLFLGLVLVAAGGLLLYFQVAAPTNARPVRYVAGGERPAVAQARLDEAAKAIGDHAYPNAFSPMQDESYEADRRGDREALAALLELAGKIENAPDAHRRIRSDAREFADRLQDVLQRYGEPEPVSAPRTVPDASP